MIPDKRNNKPAMSDELMRSFGRVQGRKLGREQQWFVDNILPEVSVSVDNEINLPSIFSNQYKEFCIEIGFGKGEHLVGYAKNNPQIGFIGCEPFINGVARLLKYIHEEKTQNIKVLHGDARLLLEKLGAGSVDKIFVLFPDPWPKVRHHKKRIINQDMLGLISGVLKKDGILEVATDHVEYGQWIFEHLEAFEGLKKISVSNDPPSDWVRTNYQAKAEKQGRGAKFLRYMNI
ncbi:MAG: tRNA (guanosine(46)-N7)-methyltransferase TrmB [Rickettsiales bacterium]|nr:tRNA (guanosine(46)-N7)-methyltransferase TrmB [Pseudomonadota bacterium]MDA0965573.1 tRNA (guanosine(46)-N7)-methyltransferase TrmB [Pseudomonadota bacterium]MDG4542897.1 tRNA (guanosine(46)-N7)-methyltransferase TrmB [Rickettsiales bacterium]MDG4544655.1 tRNA (guanosine(46)-N7)-methyltransferase TrmB [Rickettsiales bacterium]MDG4546777.1 tRNA (guanosine(46)-N7)-methyltransferase TrmB [Rickettsiales bacterium]